LRIRNYCKKDSCISRIHHHNYLIIFIISPIFPFMVHRNLLHLPFFCNNRLQDSFCWSKMNRYINLTFFNFSGGKILNNLQAKSSDLNIDLTSYAPYDMKLLSNFFKNSKYNKSSADKASSPTTAFIDAVSFPIA